MKIRFLLIGTSLSFIPILSFAQCVATQDCATLGYTETSCNGGKGVKCPFGNKWACLGANEEEFCTKYKFNQTCTGENQMPGSKICNGKYNYCNCSDGYEWKNGICIPKVPNYLACKIGSLYYSDGSCSSDNLKDKELLGVVIYEKSADENGWVMTVNPIATKISWGVYGVTTGTEQGIHSSCRNTEKLVALGDEYAAAKSSYNYKAGEKKWCLPSRELLEHINNSIYFPKVNKGISTAGGTILGTVNNGDEEWVWTSSEYGSSNAYTFYANRNGNFLMHFNISKISFNEQISVRPVFAF